MKRAICFYFLIIYSLVSCTAPAEQIPTFRPAISETSAATRVPTLPPTETPQALPTEVSYDLQPFIRKDPSELVDSRINCLVSGVVRNPAAEWTDWVNGIKNDGFTRTRFTLNFSDGPAVDLSYAAIENDLPAEYIALFRQMKDLGIQARYSLSFWDMAYRQSGGTVSRNRLSTESEIDRYLTYVKMVVTRLKGLVDGYELWNEPDANTKFFQRISPEDYIQVARQAIQVIREIDPQAKIVLVSTSSYTDEGTPEYTMKILQSDVIALADAISLHTVNNDASPVFRSDYYDGYDAMWDGIKQVAEANGFHGEYIADELNYRSNESLNTLQPEVGDYHPYEPEIAAKYIGRMIAINLGMDISVGTSGTNAHARPIEGNMIRNLAYLFDGLSARAFPVSVTSESKQIRTYTFVDEWANKYIAIWDDGEAKVTGDKYASSIVLEDTSAISVTAVDPFTSQMQNIHFSNLESSVALDEIQITDYPIILKIELR